MGVARLPARLGFGLWWIAASIAGYAIALAAWVTFSQPIWPVLSGILGGSLTLALYGATLGVGVGLAQVLVLRPRAAQAGVWLAATAAGFAVGFALASWVALAVTQAFAPGVNKFLNNSAVYLSFSLLAGVCLGVARWLALRESSALASRWIVVTTVGFVVGYGTAMGLIQVIYPLPAPVIGALYGACAGALAGLIEWLWLRRQAAAWPGVAAAPRA